MCGPLAALQWRDQLPGPLGREQVRWYASGFLIVAPVVLDLFLDLARGPTYYRVLHHIFLSQVNLNSTIN